MSGNYATIATIANDGAPQVSILANASTKRCQERNRQSRLLKNSKGMGVGKKYPGIGTHRRSTKHVWQLSELAELSAAYKAHHTTMPCWTIANMLYYSFGEQLRHLQEQDQDQATTRTHLPTIQAIQAKLMDCISLQHADTFGYASRPTQAHKQVWEHLELAEKHRDMLAKMTAAAASEPMQLQEQDEIHTPPASIPIWNVHATSFYTPDAEIEATEPPRKRRKTVFKCNAKEERSESPAVSAPTAPTAVPTMSKADFHAGIEELNSLLEGVDQARRTEKANIQSLVHQVREHNTQIGELLGGIQDAQAEIFQHRQAIAHIMEQIESIISPVPLQTPSAAGSAAPTTTPVCAKCTKTIEGELGGFSVHYADSSHPEHGTYVCDECMPMSPRVLQYFEEAYAEDAEMAKRSLAASANNCRGAECGYPLDYDSDIMDDEYPSSTSLQSGNMRGCYDHGEECS